MNHTIPFISPARAAVAARLRAGGAITPEQVRDLAAISDRAAKGYLSWLVAKEVLVRNDDGSFRPGSKAAVWRGHVPATRPGGNSSRYQAGRKLRDKLDADNGGLKPGKMAVGLTYQTITPLNNSYQKGGLLTLAGGKGVEDRMQRPPEKHLSIEQVAVAMGVSEMTVYRRIKAGALNAVRFGGQWRVPVSALRKG